MYLIAKSGRKFRMPTGEDDVRPWGAEELEIVKVVIKYDCPKVVTSKE